MGEVVEDCGWEDFSGEAAADAAAAALSSSLEVDSGFGDEEDRRFKE